ncbi:hypothetical protein GCM10022420_014530 [Streptomyces iranensis]|uniref:Uncharacterized protein n=1 Tax=Streptomyces iranensis TaxID=576784 RepID=A0A060ZYE6_9ACTN|nr:hypothetical protein [Streptomyces iranensis]CDR12710.1 predicted protein [Streptomyces iranensis]
MRLLTQCGRSVRFELYRVSDSVNWRAFACSRLDEVLVNEADALYDRFRHLGVFDRAQVRNIALRHEGRVMALRFSDTQLLSRPVPLARLRHLAEAQGHKLSLRSNFRISPRLFRAVYEEGHARP